MISTPQFAGLDCRVRGNDVRYEGTIASAVAAKLLDPARVPVSSAKWHGVFRFGRQVESSFHGAVAEVMLDHGRVVIYLFSHLVAGVAAEPASILHLPRLEGGNVVALPSASLTPVANPQRRGRYPKIVTPLWRGKVLRRNREHHEERRAREIERLHGQIEGCAAVTHACHLELARLQGPKRSP